MSLPRLLTFNAGSSSIKFGLFDIAEAGPARIASGVIDLRQAPLEMHLSGKNGERGRWPLAASAGEDMSEVMNAVWQHLSARHDLSALRAIGHRIVHGGARFTGPVRLDAPTLDAIDALTPLAPLHQPHGVRLVRAIAGLHPGHLQTASFDTAFHGTQSALVQRFALPRALHDRGIRRYGFHGLSYRSIARSLARLEPELARGRVVVAHLGSGASLCALEGGLSRDTSMGFSTLDGVPMATRCGALDPGVVLHLLREPGATLESVEDMLYHHSGLLGLSGISADSRELLASAEPTAHEALEVFALRVAGEVARLATTMGGLDGLVFTAGIGEHQPAVRAAIAGHLAWLGARIAPPANARNALDISAPDSALALRVITTDEEQVIADEALQLLGR